MHEAMSWGTYAPGWVARAVVALSRYTPLGRGAARRQLWRLFTSMHTGPVDCLLWGGKARLHPARNYTERKALMRPDRMDRDEYAVLRSRMSQPGAVFVDVGANAGLYSFYSAMHAGPNSHVLAIEPNAPLLDRLRFNLALAREAQRIDPSVNVAMAGVAVGDADGEAFLSIEESEGLSTLLTGAGQPVAVRRLAALLDDHRIVPISVIKIDVEGYEDRVLTPYLSAVPESRWPQTIIIEHVHAILWRVDCIAFCVERGYRVDGKTNNNTILTLSR